MHLEGSINHDHCLGTDNEKEIEFLTVVGIEGEKEIEALLFLTNYYVEGHVEQGI